MVMMAFGGCYLPPVEPPPPRALRGPQPLDWRSLVGCYWMDATRGRPSWPFFLDSFPAKRSPGQSRDGALRARAPGSGEPDVYWLVTSRNTLTLKLEGTGFGGHHYDFIPSGEQLRGRLLLWFHTGHSTYSRATARRVPCPPDADGEPASRP